MDLISILLQGTIPQKEDRDWFFGLWLEPSKNKGPQSGQKQVFFSWFLDNFSEKEWIALKL